MRVIAVEHAPSARLAYLSASPTGVERRHLELWHPRVLGLPPELDAVLCTSDLQGTSLGEAPGRLLGLAVADWIGELQADGRLPPSERCGLVLAGDLYTDPHLGHRGASGDVREVWTAFSSVARWTVGVLGNHDTLGDSTREEFCARAAVDVLDDEQVVLDGLRVAGLGGIIGRPDRPGRRSEVEYGLALDRRIRAGIDVVVLHESPKAAEFGHQGHPAITQALGVAVGRARPHEPPLVISGHCPWPRPHARLSSGVDVLNVDARLVVCTR